MSPKKLWLSALPGSGWHDVTNGMVPDSVRDMIVSVGTVVTSEDVDTYGRIQEIEDKSKKLSTILAAWERQHREERELRQTYAWWLLVGLFVQMLLVNTAFLAIGLKWIQVDRWVASAFILAVFSEIASMTFFVIKYLFPKVSPDVLATLEKL
jgi:hypothetical protein